ncbi:MAG TPA: hypothetical protein EYQ63_22450 [Fuerstia sp.]|jgi:uncharacterized protein|nr:hypothetical protein [Fuerstiella sp.]
MQLFAKICVDHRLLGWVLVFTLGIPPMLGFLGYRVADPLPAGWVPPEVREELREAEAKFKSNIPLVLVLESDDFFQPDRIAAMQETAAALREMEEVLQLTWMGDLPEVSLRGTQTLLIPESGSDLTPEQLAKSKQALIAHPLAVENLISSDGRTVLMLVDARQESHVQKIRSVAIEHLASVGIQTRVTGTLALYDIHNRALAEDHIRIQLLAYSLVGILLIVIFRRPMAIIIAGSGPVVGVIWTLGWLQLIGQSENELAKIILPVMVMMIGFTDGVHLVVRLRQLRSSGTNVRDSVRQSVLQTGPACLLTSITTAIGFGSLMLSNSEMIAGFGRTAAIGVIVTFLAVILISPLLAVSWVGQRMHVSPHKDPLPQLMHRLVGVISFSSRYAKAVTVTGVVITVGCMVASSRLVPDDRVSDRVPHGSEEWQAMRHCDTHLGGIRSLRLMIHWPEQMRRKDVWAVILDCEQLIAEEPLLGQPMSIRTALTVIRGPNRPDRSILVNRLPDDLKAQFYRPDLRLALVATRTQDLGFAKFDPIFERMKSQLRQLESDNPGVEVEFISDVIIEGRVVSQMIDELMSSLMMAALVIFGVLAIAFRSLRVGLISIIPNLMPLAVSGTMRLMLGDSLGIAGACSFAICLGIAVDDTIHYLCHFRHERRLGSSPLVANQRTFITVGSALMLTTVVMTAGLATVMTSRLPPHVNFAVMASTTLAVALPADLLFLPALLTLFPGKRFVTETNSEQKSEPGLVESTVPVVAQ